MANDRRRVERMASIQEASTSRMRANLEQHGRQIRERELQDWAQTLGVLGRATVLIFEYQGFSVEAVGVAVQNVSYAPGRLFIPTGDGTTLLARGVRIRRPGCRAFIEARFDPAGDFAFSLQDLDFMHQDANRDALDGLELLWALARPGRPHGSTWTLDRIAPLLVEYAEATDDREPTKQRFFEWLDGRYQDEPQRRPSVNTLDKRLSGARLTWLQWRDSILSTGNSS
jgi:hypothetical protein